jgi:prepilin-type N-terminal cleavage/methylation domain-containing protein
MNVTKYTRRQGFTLIELAVALTIVALIVGGLAVPVSTRLAEQQYTDTQASIDKAVEALYGFAITNRRLPCPDVSTAAADNRDGLEDPTLVAGSVTGCAAGLPLAIHSDANGASWGDLPWQTLGLASPNNQDAWGNRLRYAVFTPLTLQSAYAVPALGSVNCFAASGFTNINCQTSIGGITASLDIRCANITAPPATAAPGCLQAALPTPATNFRIAQNAVFVVYSHGANAWGATKISDRTAIKLFVAGSTPNSDLENIPENQGLGAGAATIAARRRFVLRTRSDASSTAGEFDDLLTFVSSNTLAAKLLAAGVWP